MADAGAPPRGKQALAAISDALVGLHREYYGKGPTKAKTFLVDDTILCLLQGGFTVVEKTLIEGGREEAVHEIRRSFQAEMKERFSSVVETQTGRKVIAYMSQVHSDPDISVELFVLEPLEASRLSSRTRKCFRQKTDDHSSGPDSYWIWTPEIARATTSRWISDVPSKIV